MAIVLVERELPEPLSGDGFSQLSEQVAWCFETHNVRRITSYMHADQKRFVCVYEGPDVDAVRRANDTAQVPYVRIWAATEHVPG